MHSAGHLLSFHVYRVGGFFGNDKIVMAQDKVTVAYYLKGSRRVAQWEFDLHADGPDGPLICRVSSGYTGPPIIDYIPSGPMVINIVSERRSVGLEKRRGTPSGTQWFRGADDMDYHWRCIAHCWRNVMQCLDTRGEIVATYRATTMARSKDGELRIYPPCNTNTEPLTCGSMRVVLYNCEAAGLLSPRSMYGNHEAKSYEPASIG